MYALLLLVGGCLSTSPLYQYVDFYPPENAEFYFQNFIQKFDKQYNWNAQEKVSRFKIFKQTLEQVNLLNKWSTKVRYAITEFADQTPKEMSQYNDLRRRIVRVHCLTKTDADIPDVNAPDSLDWRYKNIVTPVKDQIVSQCLSCYSFGATGHLEGQYALKHGKLISFSEQQLMDCGVLEGNKGCNRGALHTAFLTAKRLGGNMKEEYYPYTAQNGYCKLRYPFNHFLKDKIIPTVKDCISYDLKQQEKVKQLLYSVGPIPIAIKGDALDTYTGGVLMDYSIIGSYTHAVLLVGYGTDENGTPYWLVKNSYGSVWGEKGYFRMERSNNPYGALGMMNTWMTSAII